jgi:hypothetical protein
MEHSPWNLILIFRDYSALPGRGNGTFEGIQGELDVRVVMCGRQ